jgi:hypothetical protein
MTLIALGPLVENRRPEPSPTPMRSDWLNSQVQQTCPSPFITPSQPLSSPFVRPFVAPFNSHFHLCHGDRHEANQSANCRSLHRRCPDRSLYVLDLFLTIPHHLSKSREPGAKAIRSTVEQNDPDIGLVSMPERKTFLMPHGDPIVQPHPSRDDRRPVAARPVGPWMGAPLRFQQGNPLVDGAGPAAWAERGRARTRSRWPARWEFVPLRIALNLWLESPAPTRGMPVVAADGEIAGTVRASGSTAPTIVVYEVEVPAHGGGTHHVLLPS